MRSRLVDDKHLPDLLVQRQCSAKSYFNIIPTDGLLQSARGNPSIAAEEFYWLVLIDIAAI
jgi:hypothetical protein